MIIFDTNVISEIINDQCDPIVWAWATQNLSDNAWTTSVNLAELLAGAAYLPIGKRKTTLELRIDSFVETVFTNRILGFDVDAARRFAFIVANMKRRGEAISFADCQIAAIASVNNCAIATRDIRPFVEAGLQVVNPWDVTS